MTLDRRRALAAFLLFASAGARAGGVGGLADDAEGFEEVLPGCPLVFPRDRGAHPGFRLEWWYLAANLNGADGKRYGAQWTLFRRSLEPRPERPSWADRNLFMGHAAITSATAHLFAEAFARGGVGQAGVMAEPFDAHIDDWSFASTGDAAYRVVARGEGFDYRLDLREEGPLILHGDGGFSRKSEGGQASYYVSQPFLAVEGRLALQGAETRVAGRAWMDHEWMSRALAPDQKGWDWFSLHLAGGEKLMLFRLRGARDFLFGTWVGADRVTRKLTGEDIALAPLQTTQIGERLLPTRWRIVVKSLGLDIETAPLNARSWMATSFPYWEGPMAFQGSHSGEGYLELTGY